MTKYCDACHSANSDRAKYCCFCHGRFSGVRFGAHTSASAVADSPPPQRPRARARGARLPSTPSPTPTHGRERSISQHSAAMRAGLVLVFLVLLLGPFTHWNSSAPPERWSSIRSSVVSKWDWTAASITENVKPRLTTALAVEQPEDDAVGTVTGDGARPADAPSSRAGSRTANSAPTNRCSEAQAALSLCPKN
jgi:hypothetical protein